MKVNLVWCMAILTIVAICPVISLPHVQETSPTLAQVFSDQIKIPNSDLSLKCLALGQPLPSIKWKIDGVQVSNSQHRIRVHSFTTGDGSGTISYLNISSLSIQDGGFYECEAYNIVGHVSKRSRINIMGPPRVKPVTNLTAVAGQPFTLSCPYSGYPVNEVYFLRENRKLPFDERHAVTSLGNVHFNTISKEDSGLFKCIVVSLNGEKTEGSIFLRVSAAIVMSPFVFPDNLEEGMRASVVCSVVAGDPPINIHWFKDGRDLDKQMDSIQIVAITEFVSSLIINRLDRSFSGNYTCRATSDAGSVNYTSRMNVRAKPVWLLKPSSQTVVTGSSARMDCLADGYPQPVIRWKMTRKDHSYSNPIGSTGSSSSIGGSSSGPSSSLLGNGGSSITILSSPRIHVLENGSLIIKSVQMEDQGKYICESSNGVGKNQETSAELLVFEAPEVQPSNSQITVKRRERAELRCRAVGSPTIHFGWNRNDIPIRDGDSSLGSIAIRDETPGNHMDGSSLSTARERITLLTIHSTGRNHSGVYTCQANNNYGSDKGTIKLLVQEAPDPPTDLRVLEITSRSVSLSWTIAFNGNSPITGYEVVHKRNRENWIEGKTMFISSNPGSSNSVVVTNLSPLISYTLRMRAENDLGKSDYSQEITVTTTIEAPQFVPQNLSCNPVDSKSIKVSWTIPSSTEHIFVEGFYIGYRVMSSTDTFTYKTMHILMNQGKDLSSKEDFSSLPLSVTSSLHMVSPLSPIPMSSLDANLIHRNHFSQRKFEYTIDLLRKSTKYSIVVQAFNSKGAGPSSSEVTAETYANDPPRPPVIRMEGLQSNSAAISWKMEGESSPLPMSSSSSSSSLSSLSSISSMTISTSPYDSAVGGFILSYRRNEDLTSDDWETVRLSKQQRKYILPNLLCGNKYALKMMAFNEVGSSESSEEIHFSTEGRPPVAPDKHSFIKSNITQVSLNLNSWRDGGCPISHFIIQFKPKSQHEWVLLSNHILPEQEMVVVRDLSPSTWHDLLILSKNEAGTTEANYLFGTLTVTGATIAPMLLSDHGLNLRSPMEAVMVLVPSICAILVLLLVGSVAVYMLLCKRRLDDMTQNEQYSRQPNDTLSLNSFNKTPSKGDPIYDHQRVQVYYPSVYCTSGVGGERSTMIRATNVQTFVDESSVAAAAAVAGTATTTEYGFTLEPTRMVRKSSHGLGHHVYDVPHRFRKDNMVVDNGSNSLVESFAQSFATDDCPLNSSLMWPKSVSKELILDEIKSESSR